MLKMGSETAHEYSSDEVKINRSGFQVSVIEVRHSDTFCIQIGHVL